MFSLIISIIAIALVVATIAATMYYGGDALNAGTNKAKAAAIVSAAQQTSGAWQLHTVERGVVPASLNTLVTTNYMSVLPNPLGGTSAFTHDSATNELVLAGVPGEVCAALRAQISTQFSCVDGTGTPVVGEFRYQL